MGKAPPPVGRSPPPVAGCPVSMGGHPAAGYPAAPVGRIRRAPCADADSSIGRGSTPRPPAAAPPAARSGCPCRRPSRPAPGVLPVASSAHLLPHAGEQVIL